jgi:F-type H+-transporting ATPase subunit c
MDPVAAKYIGAGIACIGMGGAGVGVGTIFGNYLAAALRNPSAAQGQFGNLIFGFADRSARDLLAADRAAAAVRPVTTREADAPHVAVHGLLHRSLSWRTNIPH